MSQRPADHPRRLVRKLSAYAAAAASLSFTQASAGIVYTDLGAGRTLDGFRLDFNTDGIEELLFQDEFFSNQSCTTHTTSYGNTFVDCEDTFDEGSSYFVAGGDLIAQILQKPSGFSRRLGPGEPIDVTAERAPRGRLAVFGSFRSSGPRCDISRCPFTSGEFANERGFLGIVFNLGTNSVHTGWVDLYVADIESTIYGYAYETIPGRPIAAGAVPEPPSLVLLAAGAAGLAALRLRRSSTN